MNFKEQLIKHENILNKYKALYINKESQNDNDINNINNNSFSNFSENIISFNNNNFYKKNNDFNDGDNVNKNINNKANNSLLNNNINNQENSISFNNKNNLNLKNLPQEQQQLINNSDKSLKVEEKINLEKIDNLLAKLNFKRENDLNKSKNPMNNFQENNSILVTNQAPYISTDNLNKTNMSVIDNKLDITNIKAKYENNNNSFNITQKFFEDKNDENQNNDNNKLNTINNIKKLNQLNARNEIERIKAKYYSMNLNKNNNKYLDNNYAINNNINNSFVQLNKEIIEIKNKLDSYRNDLKLSYQNIIKNSIDSYIQNNDIKTKYNDEKCINIYNKNVINNNNDNNLYNKDNIQSNNQISFKNNLNIKSFDINDDLKETKKNMFNEYENNINDNNFENNSHYNNEVKNKNNFNNINYNESINNDYNNDFDYSEVLPIVDKVSKLKELNDIDEDFENQKSNNLFSDRTKITNINVNQNNNEEDEVPNIVNSILDALSNKLISSNIDYGKEKDQRFENKEQNDNLTKPNIIPKNKNFENKKSKIISFQEFLAKEEKDK